MVFKMYPRVFWRPGPGGGLGLKFAPGLAGLHDGLALRSKSGLLLDLAAPIIQSGRLPQGLGFSDLTLGASSTGRGWRSQQPPRAPVVTKDVSGARGLHAPVVPGS